MSAAHEKEWFNSVESIIDEPLKFKAKLAIGEDAYTSLRIKNNVVEFWDALGVATTAAALAKSAAVASTFFAPSGIMAAIGLGTAVTPIGWVVAAGLVTGGAWIGITRYVKKKTNSRVTVIPDFINTPMDVLALALFDLIGPLVLKIAVVDEKVDESEKILIRNSFIKEWGYSEDFVEEGMSYIESRLSEFSITNLARTLAEFKKENPDCNYEEMSDEILHLLRETIEADGKIDKREDKAIKRVEHIFNDVNKINIKKKVKSGLAKLSSVVIRKKASQSGDRGENQKS